jgi:heme-degrading monooxygenase HmoA
MAVLIRHRADGLTEELYDQVAPPLIESAKQAPGFILHVTYEDGNGFCVSEIWETQEQHDAWFNENVIPNLPMAISQETIALHSIHQP